jgi:MFS family permease
MCGNIKNEYKITKFACYATNVSMSAVGNLSPLLFVAFHTLYNVSYTLLGTLVLINFCTQMLVDMVFACFSKRFPIHTIVRLMPLLTIIGLLIFAILPPLFSSTAYVWLAIGTVVFSASSGLCEVLISPLIASIPADNPEREMSKLHSIYAWGVVGVVVVSTLFLWLFGKEKWFILALIWAIVPLVAFLLFARAKLPPMQAGDTQQVSGEKKSFVGLFLCVVCIFLGGATECTMAQWASGYLENAVGIPKVWGDVLGVAGFAVMLGIGRSWYAKKGKNILNILLICMLGSLVCYLTAGFSDNAIVSLIACALTGLCASMLWPGTLIVLGENFPKAGVTAYALMACGGDTGASVGPQMVGAIVDGIGGSTFAKELAPKLSMTAEQIGLRSGVLLSAIFPLLGIAVILIMKGYFKKKERV